jgi:cardiolipin synthase
VRIILPRRSNHPLADLGRGIPLRELQRAGGKVLFFTPGMLYAKAVLMDHQVAILGSANIDYRSLLINYEIAMCVYSLPEIEDAETWIRMLFGGCKEGIEEAGLGRHLCESIVRILTPLL